MAKKEKKAAAPAAAAPSMSDFFTRSKANEGVKLPLYLPTGEKTEHWVRIRGVDSDVFRRANAERHRTLMRLAAIEDDAERSEAMRAASLDLQCALIVDWSFPEPCTSEAVRTFLEEAPQIADAIDSAATKRALFFERGSSDSPPTPSTNSDST